MRHAEFEKMYKEYLTPVYRYVYLRVGGQKELAEDITQQTFLKAFQAFPRYQERGRAFLAYLFTVARNTLTDYWRKKQPVFVEEEVLIMVPEKDSQLDEVLDREASLQEVMTAMQALSQDAQEVIATKYVQELSTEEIAQQMGKSEAAIRQILSRSLKQLKKLLT